MKKIFFEKAKKKFKIIFFYNKKFHKQLKKLKKEIFDKTQNHDLYISPKRKNTVLEMSLKSSIMSKLDHQMSKMNFFPKEGNF